MSRRRKSAAARAAAAAPAADPALDPTFWGDAEDHPARKISPSLDPTAMLASLGPVPQPVHPQLADNQLRAVYERAAQLAVAVAAAADLLDTADDD